MHNNDNHICRVCGFWDLDEPWGKTGKDPTFFFCPCCGVEHGYADCTIKAVKVWREKWIAGGAKWDESTRRPDKWDLKEQMKNIPDDFKEEIDVIKGIIKDR